MQIARKQHYIYRGKTMNNTFEIGKKLVDFCKQGKDLEAIETLDSPNIVSVEALPDPRFTQRMDGIAAIRRKFQWRIQNPLIHVCEVPGPPTHGGRLIV